jgi:hypothetical protein
VEAFPFTDAEWASVKDTALPVVNATLAKDAALHASRLIELRELLAGLRARYGNHPVLLETEADFADDDDERVELYRRAADTAKEHGLSTLSIQLSLAQVLLDLGKPAAAWDALRACEGELGDADESDRTWHAELMAKSR